MIIYLDIETQATTDPDAIERARESVSPPGSMSKPETIAQWWKEKGAAAQAKAIADTALDGTYGSLATIGYAIDDNEPTILCIKNYVNEAALLRMFSYVPANARLCAFNGEFDFRFLMQRSVINQVKIPYMPLGRGDKYIDPMRDWAGFKGYIKQTELERVLGFERKDRLTNGGADVGAAILAGDWEAVIEHNREDIRGLQHIHRMMRVQRGNFDE